MQDDAQGDVTVVDNYLLHDGTLELASLESLVSENKLISLLWDHRNTPPDEARVLLYLDDSRILEVLPLAIEKQWKIGVLNHPQALQSCNALGVKGGIGKLVNYYLQSEAITFDVLSCNDQIVLSSVIIGEAFTSNLSAANRPPTRLGRVKQALKAMKSLRHRIYNATTGKDHKIQVAAIGLVITKSARSGLLGRSFSEALSTTDGRFTMLTVSPRSNLSYLWLLARLLIPRKINLSRLPSSVGLMRCRQVRLETGGEIDYLVDGRSESASSILFEINEQGMCLIPGPNLELDDDKQQKIVKDNIKMDHLPLNEAGQLLAGAPLPFFNRAGEEEHRGLFVALRSSAVLSSSFLVLMVLSTLLALTGLAPVIIGAMILAPLMSPIVSLAMGLARTEAQLIRNSLRTLLGGITAALACAIIMAWLMPLESLTTEMQSRLTPTLLDLGVAIVSGMAGAYAHAKEEIAKSLAGVAIAVALVPPLSVAGIGVGWAEWEMAWGAFLLFITNIVGISLAAAVTFLVLGFAPFKTATKGLTITLMLMALITIPLYITFDKLVEQARIMDQIPRGQFELAGLQVRLRNITVRAGTPPLVRVGMSSSQRIEARHVDALKKLISERIGGPIYLEAEFYLRR